MEDDIESACEVLRKGGLILYPTDTVWGIGCDATRSESVKRVFEIKRRNDSKALIVLVGDFGMLCDYVAEIPPAARELTSKATRPLTVVYGKGTNLAKELLGPDGSVGIRITSEEFSKKLCGSFGKPIVSTSANISESPTPLTYSGISDEIKNSVDYIVRHGRDDNHPHAPSSVVRLDYDGTIKILRN